MICTVGEIARFMDEIAPENWAEDWDNVGLLLGNRSTQVKRLMVALDISPAVVEEAAGKKVDMIISHHPLIFAPIKKIVHEDITGRLISGLISNNVSVYCAHTNLDAAQGGVDDTLAGLLGLSKIKYLNPRDIDSNSSPGFGRWGQLDKPTPLEEYIEFVGRVLNAPNIDFIGEIGDSNNKVVNTVALCGGSGADFMAAAKNIGADLFITGEIKYHDALMAHWSGLHVLAVGHFYSEAPIMKELINRLQTIIDSLQYKVEIFKSEMQRSPYSRKIIMNRNDASRF